MLFDHINNWRKLESFNISKVLIDILYQIFKGKKFQSFITITWLNSVFMYLINLIALSISSFIWKIKTWCNEL